MTIRQMLKTWWYCGVVHIGPFPPRVTDKYLFCSCCGLNFESKRLKP